MKTEGGMNPEKESGFSLTGSGGAASDAEAILTNDKIFLLYITVFTFSS